MSVLTIPVRIEHGRVIPKEGGALPEQGEGVLTIEAAVTSADEQATQSRGIALKERLDAVAQMRGMFKLPEEDPNDPRLNYLLRKYGK